MDFGTRLPILLSFVYSTLAFAQSATTSAPVSQPAEPGAALATPTEGTIKGVNDVIAVWERGSVKLDMSQDDREEMTLWLRHVLTHEHIPIDQKVLDRYADSLDHFSENTGIKFGHKHAPIALRWLQFCTSVAFAPPIIETNDVDLDAQEKALATHAVDLAKANIYASIPANQPGLRDEADSALKSVSVEIPKKINALRSDFLFPAFKQKFLDAQVDDFTKQIADYGPRYGKVDQMMRTREEVFKSDLDQFRLNYPRQVLFQLALEQTDFERILSKDWKDYGVSDDDARANWPILVEFNSIEP